MSKYKNQQAIEELKTTLRYMFDNAIADGEEGRELRNKEGLVSLLVSGCECLSYSTQVLMGLVWWNR